MPGHVGRNVVDVQEDWGGWRPACAEEPAPGLIMTVHLFCRSRSIAAEVRSTAHHLASDSKLQGEETEREEKKGASPAGFP